MYTFKTEGARLRFVVDQFYERIPLEHCVYCGQEWEVLDHVPPVAGYMVGSKWAFKYPACRDCNSILGAIPIRDIRVRRWFILRKLSNRYKRLIKMPHWDKCELNELKGWIKRYVKHSKYKKDFILERIDFLTDNYKEPDSWVCNKVR